MKQWIIFVGVLLIGNVLFGQEESESSDEPKAMHVGFVFGLEAGILDGDAAPTCASYQAFKEVETGLGLGVSAGMTSHFRLSSKLGLRPQVMLSIIPTRLRYDRVGFEREYKFFNPLTVDIPIHLLINDPFQTNKIGGYVGGAPEFSIPGMESASPSGTSYNLRVDGGITLPLNLGHGHYLLDLCYSYSLTDMIGGDTIYDQWWRSMNRHRFGVRLHFF